MASPNVLRGRAQIEGVYGTFGAVIVRKTNKSLSISQSFDESIITDAWGNDTAWLARNPKYELDLALHLVANGLGADGTTAESGTTRAQVATASAFLEPYQIVTFANFELTWLNTAWQYIGGATISLDALTQGAMSMKFRRYAVTAQNDLAVTTPAAA